MNKATTYRPMRLLNGLEGTSTWVMLYDDEKRADFVIARYFLNGIEEGGSCVFFTDDDPAGIRRRLAVAGVDVGRYEKVKRLRVFLIQSSNSGKFDVMKTLIAIRTKSTKGMKPRLG